MTFTCDNIAITCNSSVTPKASSAADRNKEAADKFAKKMKPVFLELAAAGRIGTSAITTELNKRELKGPRGGNWHRTTVGRVLKRLGKDFEVEMRIAYKKYDDANQTKLFGKPLDISELEKLAADYKNSK